MTPSPPPGQGPIDPRDALSPPPQPGGQYTPPPPPVPNSTGYGLTSISAPPPQREPRGLAWFGRLIFGTLAVIIFLGSLLLNVGFLASVAVKDGHLDKQTVLVNGDEKQKIAVVPIVNSMILEAQAQQLNRTIDELDKDTDVKALVLQIDTPGGSVTASDEMYHRVQEYKKAHPTVPVVVTMGGLATSGGYYTACAGDYLFAQPTTLTGNIGVLLPQYNIAKLADKYGVVDATIHSTGADFKEAGSWTKPIDPKDTIYLTDLIDSAFARFKQVVMQGRTRRLTQPIDALANGKAYTADEAKRLGLVDQIGYSTDAFAYAATKAGLTKMHVVRYDQPSTLVDVLTSGDLGLSPRKAAVSLPGAISELAGIDPASLANSGMPRLLYFGR